ncbi:hypothetical protein TGARI_301400 [Toxoplasma gondii ARI]|uniref:C3H1-type domain-containing protein n=1 Tax=Toxoplasma gondii ARI TaxID=1074872 RepID=A0A139XJK6_TOXGO|nr:hypothetical protein TGARI_301400 [Toxoplasma gondii ARI]
MHLSLCMRVSSTSSLAPSLAPMPPRSPFSQATASRGAFACPPSESQQYFASVTFPPLSSLAPSCGSPACGSPPSVFSLTSGTPNSTGTVQHSSTGANPSGSSTPLSEAVSFRGRQVVSSPWGNAPIQLGRSLQTQSANMQASGVGMGSGSAGHVGSPVTSTPSAYGASPGFPCGGTGASAFAPFQLPQPLHPLGPTLVPAEMGHMCGSASLNNTMPGPSAGPQGPGGSPGMFPGCGVRNGRSMFGSVNLVGAVPSAAPVQASGVPISRHFDVRRPAPFDLAKFDRRDPHVHFYLPVDCPHSRRCPDGCCPLAHTKLEKIFHPIVYKTQTCQMSLSSRCEYYSKCAFYHNDKDRLEADSAWRLWEHRWSSWRQQVDQILGMHNKLEKEIKRKVDGILKIRMPRQQSFQRQQQQRQAALDAHAVDLNQATTCHQDAQSRHHGSSPVYEPHHHSSYQRLMHGAQSQQQVISPVVQQMTRNTTAPQGFQSLLNIQQSALHIDHDKDAGGIGFQIPAGTAAESHRRTSGDPAWLWVADNSGQVDVRRSGIEMQGTYGTSFGFRHTAGGPLSGEHAVGRSDSLLFSSDNGDGAGSRSLSNLSGRQAQKREDGETDGGSGNRQEGSADSCVARSSPGLHLFPGEQRGRHNRGLDVSAGSPAVLAPRRGPRQQMDGDASGLYMRQGEVPGCFRIDSSVQDYPEGIWHIGTKQYASFRPHAASRGCVGDAYIHSDSMGVVVEDGHSGELDLAARGGGRRREEETVCSLAPGSVASSSSEDFKQAERQRYLSETIHFGTVQMAPVQAVPGTWAAGGGRMGGGLQSSARGQHFLGESGNSRDCVTGEGKPSSEVSITSVDAFLTGASIVPGASSSAAERLDGNATSADSTEAKAMKLMGTRVSRGPMIDGWDPTGTAASTRRSSVVTGSNRAPGADATPRSSGVPASGSVSSGGDGTDMVIRVCPQPPQVRQGLASAETAGAQRAARFSINDDIASAPAPDVEETGSPDNKGSPSTGSLDERINSSGEAEAMAEMTGRNPCSLKEETTVLSEDGADRKKEDSRDAGGKVDGPCQEIIEHRRLQEKRNLETRSREPDTVRYTCGQVPGAGSSSPVRTVSHVETSEIPSGVRHELTLRQNQAQVAPHATGATLPSAGADYSPYTLLDFCFLDDDNEGSTGFRTRFSSGGADSSSAGGSSYFRVHVGSSTGAQGDRTVGASSQSEGLGPQGVESNREGSAVEEEGRAESCREGVGHLVNSSAAGRSKIEQLPKHGFTAVANPDYPTWNTGASPFASRTAARGEEGSYPTEGGNSLEGAGSSSGLFNAKGGEFYWLESTSGKANPGEMCEAGHGDVRVAASASAGKDVFIQAPQQVCGSERVPEDFSLLSPGTPAVRVEALAADPRLRQLSDDMPSRVCVVLKPEENPQGSSGARFTFVAEGGAEAGSTGGSKPRSLETGNGLPQEKLHSGRGSDQSGDFAERMEEAAATGSGRMFHETPSGSYRENISLLYSAYSLPEMAHPEPISQQLTTSVGLPETQTCVEGATVPQNEDTKPECASYSGQSVQCQGSLLSTEGEAELGNSGGTKESCFQGEGREKATNARFCQDVSEPLDGLVPSTETQEGGKNMEVSGLQTTPGFLPEFSSQPYTRPAAASDKERSCEVQLRGITHYDRGRRSTVASLMETASRSSTSSTGFEDVLARGDTSSVGLCFPSRASSFSTGGIPGLALVSRSSSCGSAFGVRPGERTIDSLSIGASSTSPESLALASPISGSGMGSLSSVPEERHMGHRDGCCEASCEFGDVILEPPFLSLAGSLSAGGIGGGEAAVTAGEAGRRECDEQQPKLLRGSNLAGERGPDDGCQVKSTEEQGVQEERVGKGCEATGGSVKEERGAQPHEYLQGGSIDHIHSAKCSHCVYYQHLTEHLKGMLHTAMEEVQRLRCGPGVPQDYGKDQGSAVGGFERDLFLAPGVSQCERSLDYYQDPVTPGASLVFPVSSFANTHLTRAEDSGLDAAVQTPSLPTVSDGDTLGAAVNGVEEQAVEVCNMMDVLAGIQSDLGPLEVQSSLHDQGGESPENEGEAVTGFDGGELRRTSGPFLSVLAKLAAVSVETLPRENPVTGHDPQLQESTVGVVERKTREGSAPASQEIVEEETRPEQTKSASVSPWSLRDCGPAPGLKGTVDLQDSSSSFFASLATGKQLSENEKLRDEGTPCRSGVLADVASASATFCGDNSETSDRVFDEGSDGGDRQRRRTMPKECGEEVEETQRDNGDQTVAREDV